MSQCDTTKYGSASLMYIFLLSLSLTPIPSHIQKQSKLSIFIFKTNQYLIFRLMIFVFKGK